MKTLLNKNHDKDRRGQESKKPNTNNKTKPTGKKPRMQQKKSKPRI